MGDTSETNTKVLYLELFLGVVALKTPIPQNHYLRDKVPFLKSGHIFFQVGIWRGGQTINYNFNHYNYWIIHIINIRECSSK